VKSVLDVSILSLNSLKPGDTQTQSQILYLKKNFPTDKNVWGEPGNLIASPLSSVSTMPLHGCTCTKHVGVHAYAGNSIA